MASVKPPRRGRRLRILLIGLAATLLAVLGAIAWFAANVDANPYKPRIEAAVKQATGRDLALKGPIGLKLSLWPTIEARDVAFANAAGGSRPAMARLERLEARIGLLPLLQNRVEIERLVLVRPDILLETDADGRPNWIFAGEPAAPPKHPPEAAPGGGRTPMTLAIRAVSVRDGILTYRDGRTGHSTTITLENAEATADETNGPVQIASRAAFAGNPFTLTGEIGPLARLNDPASRTPWPFRLTLAGAGATLALDGTLTEPLAGRGYQAKLAADIPDLAALNRFFTHAHLPPLRAAGVSATIADTAAGALPTMSGLALHIGASDLSTVLPGLSVARATLTSGGLDQPVELAASGELGTTPLSIAGTLGPAGLLLRGPSATPYPVDVVLTLAGAKASVDGTIADPRRLDGADLTVSAHVADLAALSQGLGRDGGKLAPIHTLDLKTRLADGPGGFRQSAVLRDLELRVPGADLGGELRLAYGGRPSLTGTLTSQLIDADRLFEQSATAEPPASPPSPPRSPAPPASAPPAEPPVSAPPARPPAPAQRAPLFSNTPLPFGVLTLADADLGLTIGALRARGTAYRDIRARLVLADGKLTLDPLAAGVQGGHLDARLTADARAESPPVALVLRGTGIDLTPLLAVLGAPEAARGAVDLDLDLHGTGQTAHALALSADGHLGAAMVDGAIDNRVITAALGTVLAQAHLPNLASRPGTTAVRCLAVRLDAHGGTANLRTFLLDTPLFAIEGGGTLDLAQETLALRLRPLARLGGTGVIVPLRLAGPFQSPKVEVDASGRAGGGAGTTAQEPASIIIGALTDDRRVAGTGGEGCPAALAEARGGIAGRTPAASPQEAPKPPKPADLLRQFLR